MPFVIGLVLVPLAIVGAVLALLYEVGNAATDAEAEAAQREAAAACPDLIDEADMEAHWASLPLASNEVSAWYVPEGWTA